MKLISAALYKSVWLFLFKKTMLQSMQVGPGHKYCKSAVPINFYVFTIVDRQIFVFSDEIM